MTDAFRHTEVTRSAVALNAAVTSMDEAVCVGLLVEELGSGCRGWVLRRLHSRLNKVRYARERAELRSGTYAP